MRARVRAVHQPAGRYGHVHLVRVRVRVRVGVGARARVQDWR